MANIARLRFMAMAVVVAFPVGASAAVTLEQASAKGAVASTEAGTSSDTAASQKTLVDPAADDGSLQIIASAIPEPASWALLVGGFVLVGATLRRKKSPSVTD